MAKNKGKAKITVKPAVCQFIPISWFPKTDKIANRQWPENKLENIRTPNEKPLAV